MSTLNKLEQDPEFLDYLIRRVGKAHLRQRIGVETEHKADRFGQGRTFLHIENWASAAAIIKLALKLTGLTARGEANVLDFQVRHNRPVFQHLPAAFDGYTVLHLSDLHLDSLATFPDRLAEAVSTLEYDVCVLTGDYRFHTHGPHGDTIRGLERLRRDFRGKPPVATLAQQDSADRAPLYMAVESFRGQRNGGRSDRRHNAR